MKEFGTRGTLVAVLFALTTMLGCGALDAGTPAAQSATGLVATSATLDFGSVAVGTTAVRTNTIVNTSHSPIVLTRAQTDQTDFKVTGQTLPLTLAPGQRAVMQIAYSPQGSGSSQGRVVLAGNVIRLSTIFGLRGTAIAAGRIRLTPASIGFGNVQVGKTQTQSATLSNLGKTPVTVTRAAISGKGFNLTGISLPMVLKGGESTTASVSFTPASGGAASGTITVIGTVALTQSKRPVVFGAPQGGEPVENTISTTANVPVSGNGMGAGQLAVSPSSLALGSVRVGASQTQSAALVNSGSSDLTVRQATITGRGFRMSGISFPLTLGAGQRKNFTVTFTPQSAGSASGSIAVTSDAPNAVVSMPVSAVATAPGALLSNPSSLSFGSVQLGKGQTLSAALTNSGGSSVTVSQANVSSSGFTVSGLNLPMTLAAGQSAAFSVTFNPQSGGAASAAVSFASDASNGTLAVPLSGSAVTAGSLTSTPSSLNFGSVQAGTPQTVSETLTNSGGSSVIVSQANVSGAGFAITGLNLPVTLAAGQSTVFSVTFNSQSSGAASGNLSIASDASNSTLNVPLAASVATAGTLTSTPSSLNFGSVQAGSPQTVAETLTNSGGSSLTITQANFTGTGFALSGLTLPMALAAGQSTTFNVTFTPQSSGAANGSLAIASNASNSTLSIPLTANAATAGVLSTSDSSISFGSVKVSDTASQPETLTNTGGSSVTITQAKASGAGFSVTGLSLPMTLNPGQSFTFGTAFTPTTGGSATGSISVVSDATNSTLTITLAGTATVAGQLAVSPATLNFGSVTVGQSKSLTASITATGSSITVSDAAMSTAEFTISGLALPVTLTAGQSASFTVNFKPQASGAASASGSFNSNASNPSVVQALSGTGAAAPQHSVALSWSASSSSVVGYNIYRGTTNGGPYSKISSLNADSTFTDSLVQAGQTYFYVTTAVDGSGKESKNSNQTQAVIPTP